MDTASYASGVDNESKDVKCVTFLYVSSIFGHNSVKNAYKIDLFRPKMLKYFLYKPHQSVLRYLHISRKIDKKGKFGCYLFICSDTIKSIKKYLFLLFSHF